MSKMYKLMSLKGYNGPEDVIKLQEWLAIEKQIFIETRVCWNKEGTFPIGYSARAWMPPYTLYTVASTELTIEEAVMAILARIYDYI